CAAAITESVGRRVGASSKEAAAASAAARRRGAAKPQGERQARASVEDTLARLTAQTTSNVRQQERRLETGAAF
ncbi:MAG TPA: hypothetical protein VK494_01505, partial [Gemmatimonadaceae bacterium]|nr:hypothetical protein [Gemmatimonadaceae bacterium]